MLVDVAFAKEHNIAILPFVMESGIDNIYSLPNNFGEKQYLSPFKTDMTAISYEEKLKKILESILISDEMAKCVRSAFDAYIFLSYRKKDRKYANELMRTIHSIPLFEYVAIWYDEFLTPGESYKENIELAIEKSDLFALLVTPNVLEDGNFVMTVEYPAAINAKKNILPIEMKNTDYAELSLKFPGIQEPAGLVENKLLNILSDTEEPIRSIDENIFNALFGLVLMSPPRDNEDEHDFLIGLAYLEGIDVEVDIDRGVALVTRAADRGYPKAMEKLYNMYTNGEGVKVDYREALKWAVRLVNYDYERYGEEHPNTLASLNNLASAYGKIGEYEKSLEITEKNYEIRCRILGEEHLDTLISLNNLAYYCYTIGEYSRAIALSERAYELARKSLGEEHPTTLSCMNNLASAYGKIGKQEKALELYEKAYEIRCRILGEEHPDALISLNNLASAYVNVGEETRALELFKKAYFSMSKVLGANHPTTLQITKNLNYLSNKLIW